VGLSGGVDSAVSVALLKRAGADVAGAFIKTWQPDWMPNACDWKLERRDAMRVATHLDIPFVTIDLESEYKKSVVDYMISEYKLGRTPNPDVMCNKEIKFGAFLSRALELGADMIATGHYSQSKMVNSKWQMLMGEDEAKDQSYFLWTLNQAQLSKIIFPVGHLLKSEVRELARKFRLPVAEKRDSQGICFLGHIDMKEFLSHYIETKPGHVLNESGQVVGEHKGSIFYTIGQSWQRPLYVLDKNLELNTIIVGQRPVVTDNTRSGIICPLKRVNWIADRPKFENEYAAQVRYHGEKLLCHITHDPHSVWGNECVVQFDRPVLVAPGQSVVMYDGDVCLGGGVVE